MPLIRLFLLAIGLLLALPATAAPKDVASPPAPYVPALWKVKDPRTGATATLFGTVHSLPRGVDWFRPHIARALDEADRVVLETMVPDNPGAALPAVMRLARLPAPRAEAERLPESWRPAWERVQQTLKPGILEWYDTWYIALTVANLQSAANGMDPRIGVEAVLSERARIRGKPIEALETLEQQLIYFDALTEVDQQQMLMTTIEGLDSSKAESTALIADWLAGRTDALAGRVNREFERTPMLRQMLVEDRNERWAAWLDTQMRTKGTRPFVAVGAGHLAGPGSLIAALQKRGFEIQRIAPEPPPPPKKRQRRK